MYKRKKLGNVNEYTGKIYEGVNKKFELEDTEDYYDELYYCVTIKLSEILKVPINEAAAILFESHSVRVNELFGAQGTITNDQLLEEILEELDTKRKKDNKKAKQQES